MTNPPSLQDEQPENPVNTDDLDEFLGAEPQRPWYKRKRILAGILFLFLAIVVWAVFGGGNSGSNYATTILKKQDIQVTVTATGNLQSTNEVEVSSEQSGLVTQVFVDNNDRVTRGQRLAQLDTSLLSSSLTQSKAALAANEAQVLQYRAALTKANADLARQLEVYKLSNGQVPSATEIDAVRAEQQAAAATLKAGYAQVEQARATVSLAQTDLGKATIYSPVTGVVLSRSIDTGQTVAASLSAPVLFTIAEDLSQMELDVSVDEADVGQVKDGQKASFTVDAYPGQKFSAVIKRVDVGANASDNDDDTTSTSDVVSYTAVLSVANPDLILRPGMTATAQIIAQNLENVLAVPNAALRFEPSSTSTEGDSAVSNLLPGPPRSEETQQTTIGRGSSQKIYILNSEGQPEARDVMVGVSNGTVTQVTSTELKEGDKVITGQLASASGGGGTPEGPQASRATDAIFERSRFQRTQHA